MCPCVQSGVVPVEMLDVRKVFSFQWSDRTSIQTKTFLGYGLTP
jgi:hypothetical protein